MTAGKIVCLSICLSTLLLWGCGERPVDPPPKVTTVCACDEFPFPQACKSACDVGEATVKSVNTEKGTAEVTIRRGGQTEEKTVALSALPAGKAVTKGSTFATLLKRDAAQPENSRIVRFTAK